MIPLFIALTYLAMAAAVYRFLWPDARNFRPLWLIALLWLPLLALFILASFIVWLAVLLVPKWLRKMFERYTFAAIG